MMIAAAVIKAEQDMNIGSLLLLVVLQGSYPGTLFRFPLRSSTTAATSDIKSAPTSAAQALQLLQSLAEVLPQALLFLKSLKQIEVYVVGDVGAGAVEQMEQGLHGQADTAAAAAAPQLLFRASLASLDGKHKNPRQLDCALYLFTMIFSHRTAL